MISECINGSAVFTHIRFGLLYLLWVPCFEEVMSTVDNIEIISWDGVHGKEWLEDRGCGENMIAFCRTDSCFEKGTELCCAAPQDIARAQGIHRGRFWLYIGKTLCQ